MTLELEFVLREAEIVVGMMERAIVRRGSLRPLHDGDIQLLLRRARIMKQKIQLLMDRDSAVAEAYMQRTGHVLEPGELYCEQDFELAAEILKKQQSKEKV